MHLNASQQQIVPEFWPLNASIWVELYTWRTKGVAWKTFKITIAYRDPDRLPSVIQIWHNQFHRAFATNKSNPSLLHTRLQRISRQQNTSPRVHEPIGVNPSRSSSSSIHWPFDVTRSARWPRFHTARRSLTGSTCCRISTGFSTLARALTQETLRTFSWPQKRPEICKFMLRGACFALNIPITGSVRRGEGISLMHRESLSALSSDDPPPHSSSCSRYPGSGIPTRVAWGPSLVAI